MEILRLRFTYPSLSVFSPRADRCLGQDGWSQSYHCAFPSLPTRQHWDVPEGPHAGPPGTAPRTCCPSRSVAPCSGLWSSRRRTCSSSPCYLRRTRCSSRRKRKRKKKKSRFQTLTVAVESQRNEFKLPTNLRTPTVELHFPRILFLTSSLSLLSLSHCRTQRQRF